MIRNFTLLLMTASLLLVSSRAFARENESQKNVTKKYNASVALSFDDFDDDFGYGLHLVSPYFFNKSLAVKFAYNLIQTEMLLEGSVTNEQFNYNVMKLGLITGGNLLLRKIRAYLEMGGAQVTPDRAMSDDTVLSFYATFGFEFFTQHIDNLSHFFEVGGVASEAIAEKVVGKPAYMNGGAISVGLRYYF